MIVVMKPNSSPQQIAHAEERVRALGMKPHTILGEELTVIALVGNERNFTKELLLAIPGVDRVMEVARPYKLVSNEGRKESERTIVKLHPQGSIGGRQILVVAGPCSVESEEQVFQAADAVKKAGGTAFRAGAFKPRTNPYSFQGMQDEGLKLLIEVRRRTGLAIFTEVLTPADVEKVADAADVVQIGTRNAQNFPLLSAVGELRKPVLLKRGFASTLDEFLLGAEYIMSRGNGDVILCERGIRTFETHTRNTLPLATVPAIKERSHLPIMVDPSHGTGKRSLVPAMALAAVAAGADALMIEVHPDPESALTDGDQSISSEEFAALIPRLRKVAEAVDREI
ncbi:MAG TPA: 3-deoxy-7-phosphoheptulonate synthase [Planctomycetota bacterium]|nr:3-deoxy-7-phosphoheptulonate synthase [Planctomycetota bacterium]